MALNTKVIKSRIKSVSNTKKITSAMEKVAAAKMRKAVQSTLNTREYSRLAQFLMEKLGKNAKEKLPLLEERVIKKELVIVFSSNRGLCGSYNSKVIAAFDKYSKENPNIDVVAVGSKAAKHAKSIGMNLTAVYDKMPDSPAFEDILPVAKTSLTQFIDKTYDKVTIIYTNYISGLKQEVEVKTLLPLKLNTLTQMDDQIAEENINIELEKSDDDYILEPSPIKLLDYVLPRIFEIQIFQALLESTASEHSSRMIAMKNASDSAGELRDALTLEFNKARQAAITQEISEIVGTAAALS